MVVWPKLKPHPVQTQLWTYTGKYAAVAAGRGSGKTEISRRRLVLEAMRDKPWPDPKYYYILPTFRQALSVAYNPLLQLIDPSWLKENGANRSELSIKLVNGATIFVVGADRPQRIEGVQADMVVVDESCDQKPQLFDLTIVPMLTHRNGICWRIGVPKRSGKGRAEFKAFWNLGTRKNDLGIASFHWKTREIADQSVVAQAKALLSEDDYNEQFEAEWLDSDSTVYYGFHYGNLVENRYDPSLPIWVACDFNVDPMSWLLAHFKDGKIQVFEERVIRNTNTPNMLDRLYADYHHHLGGWNFVGDASANSRKTSSTVTDYYIIKNDARFGARVFFPPKNPAIRDRIATVNRAFKASDGSVRLFISPNCARLVRDIEAVSYIDKTTELHDYSGTGIGHLGDALGYLVSKLLPLRVASSSVPVIHVA